MSPFVLVIVSRKGHIATLGMPTFEVAESVAKNIAESDHLIAEVMVYDRRGPTRA